MTYVLIIAIFVIILIGIFINVSHSDDEHEVFFSPKLYKSISLLVLILGVLSGIACGFTYKTPVLNYEYPHTKMGDVVTAYKFNVPIMFYVWIAATIISFATIAFSSHIENQNNILTEIKKQNDLIKGLSSQISTDKDIKN